MKKALFFLVVALIFASGLLAGKCFNVTSPAESEKTSAVVTKPVVKTGSVVMVSKKKVSVQSQLQETTGSIRIRGKF